MKTFKMTPGRLAIVLVMVTASLALVSWDFQKSPYYEKIDTGEDTVPSGKRSDVRVHNLDEAIAELERADIDRDIENALAEAAKALKEVDFSRIRADIEESMKDIDLEKIQRETNEAMAKVDFARMEKEIAAAMKEASEGMKIAQADLEKAFKSVNISKIQEEVKRSLSAIDWTEMKKELEKAKKVDLDGAEKELSRARRELEKMGPELRKNLEKAKQEIEKAKTELRVYKELVDGLHADGLLDKDADYSIEHKNGKLNVNGKEASDAVYNKYKKILENQKEFHLQKNADGLHIDHDGGRRI